MPSLSRKTELVRIPDEADVVNIFSKANILEGCSDRLMDFYREFARNIADNDATPRSLLWSWDKAKDSAGLDKDTIRELDDGKKFVEAVRVLVPQNFLRSILRSEHD